MARRHQDVPTATYQTFVVDIDNEQFQVFAPNQVTALAKASKARKAKGKAKRVKVTPKKKGWFR